MDYYKIKTWLNTVELPDHGIIDDNIEDYATIYRHGYTQAIRDVMYLFMIGEDVTLDSFNNVDLQIDLFKSE